MGRQRRTTDSGSRHGGRIFSETQDRKKTHTSLQIRTCSKMYRPRFASETSSRKLSGRCTGGNSPRKSWSQCPERSFGAKKGSIWMGLTVACDGATDDIIWTGLEKASIFVDPSANTRHVIAETRCEYDTLARFRWQAQPCLVD